MPIDIISRMLSCRRPIVLFVRGSRWVFIENTVKPGRESIAIDLRTRLSVDFVPCLGQPQVDRWMDIVPNKYLSVCIPVDRSTTLNSLFRRINKAAEFSQPPAQ